MNIDCTLYIDGVHGDSSIMVKVGEPLSDIAKLINTTQKALYKTIKICRPGTPFKEIGPVCE